MKSRAFLPAAGAAAAAVLLLTQAEMAAQAVREGISLCLTSVVPSLFPFFALSSLPPRPPPGEMLCSSSAITRHRL